MGQPLHVELPKRKRTTRARAPRIEALESRYLMSAAMFGTVTTLINAAPLPQSITPAQARASAGIGGQIGNDGGGQTIAIVVPYSDTSIATDLQQFDRQFQLADPPSFSIVNSTGVSNVPAANATWTAETALDVEWAHAFAPQARIVLVQAASDQPADLAAAVDTARHLPGVSVVSMSWGVDAFDGSSFNQIFTTPTGHNGVTFVGAGSDSAASATPWPASLPSVLDITISSAPNYTLVINDTVPGANTITFSAMSGTSYAVYNSAGGGWQSIGGTSALTPQWAGLIAIANELRANLGLSSIDGASSGLLATVHVTGATGGEATWVETGYTDGGTTSTSNQTGSTPPATTPTGTTTNNTTGKPRRSRAGAVPPRAQAAAVIYAQGRIASVQAVAFTFTLSNEPIEINVHPVAFHPAKLADTIPPANNASKVAAATVETRQPVPRIHLAAIDLATAFSDLPLAAAAMIDGAEVPTAFLSAVSVPDVVPMLHPLCAANVRAAFCDTLAVFMNESAAGTHASAAAIHSHRRAWMITGAVLAGDAVLLRIMLTRRYKKARKVAVSSGQPVRYHSVL